jgi:hypothetical protein
VALTLLSPLAHAQIIFFDDFTEDATGTYTPGLAGTQNNLTYAPSGALTNYLNWTSNAGTSQIGSAQIYAANANGYPTGTTATNGSHTEAYIANPSGAYNFISTPILNASDSAVNLVAGATYTLSLDVGARSGTTMNTLGIDLLAGSTVLDPSVTIGSNSYTDEVTASQLTGGQFTNFSFTIPASALVGDSGALSIQLTNVNSNGQQVNISNIEVAETVPEPGTWAMLLGGLGALLFLQRIRPGLKV